MIEHKGVVFSEQQEQAVQKLMDLATGKLKDKRVDTLILTGQAGTGKSTIISYLRKFSDLFSLCATTGKASILLGCATVDRLFQFKRPNEMGKPYTCRNRMKLDHKMPGHAGTIIIDEASMVGYGMAKYIEEVAFFYKKNVVLVGDWAQSSPVKDEWPTNSEMFKRAEVVNLETTFRQQGDDVYLRILNKIRDGEIDDDVRTTMGAQVCSMPEADDVTKIFATNSRVDDYNQTRLHNHCITARQTPFKLWCKLEDKRPVAIKERYPMSDDDRYYVITQSRFSHCSSLALGAQVMLTRNIWCDEANYMVAVNGDTGKLVDVVITDSERGIISLEDEPMDSPLWDELSQVSQKGGVFSPKVTIELDRNGQRIEVPVTEAYSGDEEDPDAIMTGIPLTLAYAVTIHKVQGSTLHKAWVDMRSILYMKTKASQHGLAYVALSRTRELKNLGISCWEDDAVYCDPIIKTVLKQRASV